MMIPFMPAFFGHCLCCSKVSYRRYSTASPPVFEQRWDVGGPAQPFAVDPSDGGIYVCKYPKGNTSQANALAKYDNAGNQKWATAFTSVSTIYPSTTGGLIAYSGRMPFVGGVTVSPDVTKVAWAGQFVRIGSDSPPIQCLVLTDTLGNLLWDPSARWAPFSTLVVLGNPLWSPDGSFIFLVQQENPGTGKFWLIKIDASTGAIIARVQQSIIYGDAASLAFLGGTLVMNGDTGFLSSIDQTTLLPTTAYSGGMSPGKLYALSGGTQLGDGSYSAAAVHDGRPFSAFAPISGPTGAEPQTAHLGPTGFDGDVDGGGKVYFGRGTQLVRFPIALSDPPADYTYTIPQKTGPTLNPSVWIRVDPSTQKPITGGDYVAFVKPG